MNKVFDKKGREIKVGDIILISNSRGCYNQKAKVIIRNDKITNGCDVLGYELLTGHEKGKFGLLTTWIEAIWRATDKPENFLEVIESE